MNLLGGNVVLAATEAEPRVTLPDRAREMEDDYFSQPCGNDRRASRLFQSTEGEEPVLWEKGRDNTNPHAHAPRFRSFEFETPLKFASARNDGGPLDVSYRGSLCRANENTASIWRTAVAGWMRQNFFAKCLFSKSIAERRAYQAAHHGPC